MPETTMSEPPSPFEIAVESQRALERSLSVAGLDLAEFPLMSADINPLGEPRVNLGPITPETAGRLTRAITLATACPHVAGHEELQP